MSQYKISNCDLVDVEKIIPNPKNPNKHPEKQIKMLAKILDYQGQRLPIVVSNRTGFIVAGHGRLEAIKQLGWEKAAVSFQDFDNEAQEYAHMIADNKIAELAEHDDSMMIDEIKALEIEDFELLGLDDFEIPLEPDEAKDAIEDDVPTDVETRCKLGDLWILGEHRLLCGDSTNIQHVERLMGGEKADMVFTDPPYGMKFDAEAFGYENIKGDHDDFTPDLINTIFQFDCDEIFIWGADYFAELLPDRNKGSFVVWDKRVEERYDRMIGSGFELCWSKQRHKRELARINYTKFGGVKDDSKKRVHPTQKPVQLSEWFFDKWGKDKKNIVDLYGGSGSTLIACEKTNRKCFMMELDPHYCDVILSRWEKYSGKTAELLSE